MKVRKWKLIPVDDPSWWFVISVYPTRELSVRKQLAKKAIFNFCPMRVDKVILRNQIRLVQSAVFPGYVFVSGDHYRKFLRIRFGLKHYVNTISMIETKEEDGIEIDEPEVYRMHKSIVKHLILCQEAGYFDFTKGVNQKDRIFVGDLVDVLGSDEQPNLLIKGIRVFGIVKGKALFPYENRMLKIRFCFLRKSADI